MINGLYIDQSGDAQVIGNVQSFQLIIASMAKLMSQLREQECNNIAAHYSKEELERIIALKDKENNDS